MVKVTVLGAAGGVGQPLSLLLKLSPYITELSLYDIQNSVGVGADLSHINTNSDCSSFDKNDLVEALVGSDIVIIPAGMARKKGMTRDDLFKVNANVVRLLCLQVGRHCPEARVLVISNPVNCLVPVAVETFKELGCFQAGNVMGITTLDIVRAETFLGDLLNKTLEESTSKIIYKRYEKTRMREKISVIGGHSGTTIVPIILDKNIINRIGRESYEELVHRIQFGGDEVIQAKNGNGSATLSMAYAGYQFTEAVLRSMYRENNQVADSEVERPYLPAYVYLPDLINGSKIQEKLGQDITYFSIPVKLINGSVESVDDSIFNVINQRERELLEVSMKALVPNIEKGTNFVKKSAKL